MTDKNPYAPADLQGTNLQVGRKLPTQRSLLTLNIALALIAILLVFVPRLIPPIAIFEDSPDGTTIYQHSFFVRFSAVGWLLYFFVPNFILMVFVQIRYALSGYSRRVEGLSDRK